MLLHALTGICLTVHVSAGAVALVAGVIALSARKGGALHRRAGRVFVASMAVLAVFACYLALVIPGQLVNVFISVLAAYLIWTASLTVRRRQATGLTDGFALLVGVTLCAPFAILSVQLAAGWPPLFTTAVAFKGPVLIAIYGLTSVLGIAAIGDARWLYAGGSAGAARISRHLWRMCVGLTLALGSGFTNGLARRLPGPYHVPGPFFFPQLIPLVLLIAWLIRVRMPGWQSRAAAAG